MEDGHAQPALDLVRGHWERAIYPRARAGDADPFDSVLGPNARARRGRESRPRAATARPFDCERGPRDSPPDELAAERVRAGALSEDRHARRTARPQRLAPRAAGSGDEGHLGQLRLPVAGAAQRLGVADGDVVRVTAADGAPPLELPAFVQPGQHDASVAIALGYGRAGTDRFAKVGPPWFEARPPAGLVGVNASALVTSTDSTRRYSGRAVTVVKTGRTHQLASTQVHHSLERTRQATEPRPIIQEMTLAQLTGAASRSRSAARERR